MRMFAYSFGHRSLRSLVRCAALFGALLSSPVLVAGCSSDDGGSTGNNVGNPGGGGSSGSNNPGVDDTCGLPAACDLIDGAYLGEELDVEMPAGKPQTKSGDDSTMTDCSFVSTTTPMRTVSVSVRCSSFKSSFETTVLNPYLAQGYELASGFDDIADHAIWKVTETEDRVNLQLVLLWNDTRMYVTSLYGPFTPEEARTHLRAIAHEAFNGLNSKLASADQQCCCCQWLVPFGTSGTSVALG